jgi:hypothetical protein
VKTFPGDWIRFLQGNEPDFPTRALRDALTEIRARMASMAADTSTPDTRLADDPMDKNPATVAALINLMLGGIHPGNRGSVLHSRLRYFDPVARRAGLPPDVAALVERMTDDQTIVSLVNINQIEGRTVMVQTGAYGEHQCQSVRHEHREVPIGGRTFQVQIEPGCGAQLVITARRYANPPTLRQPWGPGRN